jgi:predicted MFS family arabinose efflux permease
MRPERLLALIAATGFASSAAMRIFDPILPMIAREFGRSAAEVAILAVGFTLSYAVTQFLMGPLGDSYGKLRVMSLSMAGVSVSTIATAIVPAFSTLIWLRIGTGVFAGGIIPLCLALYGDLVPVERRHLMLTRFMTANVTGQIVGSLASGMIADHFGWRAVPVVLGLFGLAAALGIGFMTLRVPERRRPFSIASALAGYRQVLGNRRALRLLLLVAMEGISVYGVFPFVAAILEMRHGAGAREAGFVVGGFGLGGLAFGLTAGLLIRHQGQTRIAVLGGALMAVAYGAFALGIGWVASIGIFATLGYGFSCLHSTLQTQATELAPTLRGSSLSLFAGALFSGIAVGPFVFAFMLGRFGSEAAIVLFMLIAAATSFVAPLLLGLAQVPART